jgi:hypothetical protein
MTEAMFEYEGETFPLSEMTMANAESPELIEWLNAAQIGDSRDFGGGAAPSMLISRVA